MDGFFKEMNKRGKLLSVSEYDKETVNDILMVTRFNY